MAARFWVGGTGSWTAANTANWSATSGGAGGVSVPVDGDTVTFDGASGGGVVTVGPGYDPTMTSLTMGAFTGTLDFSANNNSPTMDTLSWTGTAVRTLNLGSGTWTIRGNNATVLDGASATNLTITGSGVFNLTYSGSTGTRNLSVQNLGNFTTQQINITAGSDIIGTTNSGPIFYNLNFTGFTGTWVNGSATTYNIKQNLTLSSGMTNSVTAALNFNGTSGTITSNGKALASAITITTGNYTLADALTTTGTLTLTAGGFDANNFNVTCGSFASSNSNVRTLTMGSGTWTLTGSGSTIWSTSTTTNMTWTATTANVVSSYSGGVGTRQFSGMIGPGTPVTAPKLFITAGTDTVSFTNSTSAFQAIDFTGFSGTLTAGSATTLSFREDLILSPTMTNSYTGNINFNGVATAATAGVITTNGIQLNSPINIGISSNAIGWTLGSNLVNTSTITFTQGTLNLNNYNVTCTTFASSNSNVRTLNMGSGTVTLTGTGTVWNMATTSNLTFNSDTSTIVVNDSSASSKTLSLGALTYYDLLLTGGGTGTMIIGTSTATKTFHGIRVDEPLTVQVFAGSTLVLTSTNFNVTGNGGQFNTFQSTSAGTPWTLSVASGNVVANYISLQDSVATGGATFYAGANSIDVSGNSGWIFTNEQGGAGQTAKIDNNGTRAMLAVSNADFETPVRVAVDGTSGALLVSVG
jgi:hypothetical protein